MAHGYWEIYHLKNKFVYVKGAKNSGKTKFIHQMALINMLMFDWYNVFFVRRELKQHMGSTAEQMKWAMSFLSKLIKFPVESVFKIRQTPLQYTHKYYGNVAKTFAGNPKEETRLSSQEVGGVNGIVGLLAYDEPVRTKMPSEEEVQEEEKFWNIVINSNLGRGTEFATQEMLDHQMCVVACNPWQPNSSFDNLYATPFIELSREELKQKLITDYKYRKIVPNFSGNDSLMILISNALIIKDIHSQTIAGQNQIASTLHAFNDPNLNASGETFYIGLNGFIEGGVYESHREAIVYKENVEQLYPHPIALSFGVDYANKRDNMVLSIIGYSQNYQQEIKYQDIVISPSEHRNQQFRDIFIANSYVMSMLRWLKRLQMPKNHTWICTVDGDFFRQTLNKAWLDYMEDPNLDSTLRYTISFKEKANLKVIDRVKDDKELMGSNRLIVDKNLCARWSQEIATIQWSNDGHSAFAGNDDTIQATHYARDPYRKKIMKGKRKYDHY